MPAPRPNTLVLCEGDPARDPRPHRTITWLRDHFDVRVLSRGPEALPGTTHVPLPSASGSGPLRRVRNAVDLKLCRFERRLWPAAFRRVAEQERAHHPAFIVVHDLALLPLALAIRDGGRVFFDAREYYPRHFEERWLWRFFFQGFNRHLCATYLRQADVMVTVCPGLAEAYRREFGIACGVLPGFARPVALAPSPVDPDCVRLIHHGFASRSRRLELMFEVMRLTDARFRLELMLVGNDAGYQAELRRRASGQPRVTFQPPVPFQALVQTTNRYDIGLFFVPPVNFNLRHALPNKFFEFIQARLMIAIGPAVEMAPFVRAHELGVMAADFAPATLARQLNALTTEQIVRFKQNAHRAAAQLHAGVLRDKFLRVAVDGAGTEVFT